MKYIDKGDTPEDSQVAGVKPKMVGDKVYMTLWKKDRKFYFIELDFSTNTARGSQIHHEIEECDCHTVFAGTTSQTVDAITIYQAYTIGYSKKIEM